MCARVYMYVRARVCVRARARTSVVRLFPSRATSDNGRRAAVAVGSGGNEKYSVGPHNAVVGRSQRRRRVNLQFVAVV
jgi:hypothetical protein